MGIFPCIISQGLLLANLNSILTSSLLTPTVTGARNLSFFFKLQRKLLELQEDKTVYVIDCYIPNGKNSHLLVADAQ